MIWPIKMVWLGGCALCSQALQQHHLKYHPNTGLHGCICVCMCMYVYVCVCIMCVSMLYLYVLHVSDQGRAEDPLKRPVLF